MWTRLVLALAGLLLALKLFAPAKLRALGRQIDRGVNLTLIGLGIVYTVQIAIYFYGHR